MSNQENKDKTDYQKQLKGYEQLLKEKDIELTKYK